jgi:hypothetical protein
MAVAPDPRDSLDAILEWIGFEEEVEREAILDEAFEDWEDLFNLKSSDIDNLNSDFCKKEGDEKIQFGLKRTRRLKNLILWVQDYYRCGEDPSIEDMDEASFLESLGVAATRAEIRKSLIDQADSTGREASPGKLKDEDKWTAWSEGLRNYLSTQLGVSGVPLSYVIRAAEAIKAGGFYCFAYPEISSLFVRIFLL